jgi:hypothetical protein
MHATHAIHAFHQDQQPVNRHLLHNRLMRDHDYQDCPMLTVQTNKREIMSELKLPVTVLLSSVPQEGAGWQALTQHACGGFSRKSLTAYVYVLKVLPVKQEMLDDILFEQFLGDITAGLDNGASDKQRAEYRAFLQRHGVTVNDANLAALMQAVYPMDASEKNLVALTGKVALKDITLDGLQIAVLGDNCV